MEESKRIEVEVLYKQASQILIHEMSEEEWLFVHELGFDDRTKMSEDSIQRLRDLVKRKSHNAR